MMYGVIQIIVGALCLCLSFAFAFAALKDGAESKGWTYKAIALFCAVFEIAAGCMLVHGGLS